MLVIELFNLSSLVDGSYLMTCGSDKKLKLWNPLSGLLLKTYGGHAHEVTDAAGSCDRYEYKEWFLVNSEDKYVSAFLVVTS